MASPGPAPPCVQATPVKEPDRRARREPTRPEAGGGKGLTPPDLLCVTSLWYGNRGGNSRSGIGPGEHGRNRTLLSLSFRLWV